jgi:hypothetical protein
MVRFRPPWRACVFVALSAVVLAGLATTAAQNPPSKPSSQSAPPPLHPPVIDPKAQQLLDKVIEALGGQAFLQFKTMTSRGRAFTIADESTAGLAVYVSQVEYPDKRRFTYGASKPVVLINNGDQAWELDKFGVTSQFPDQAERWKITNRYSLENLLRLRIREPGVLVQMGGVDFVDNLAAQIIEVVDARQVGIKLFINPKTFLPLRISYQVPNPKTHEQDEYADVYADYRTFQGIQTPLHIARFVNDERSAETYRNSVKYDETYPPETFATPGR